METSKRVDARVEFHLVIRTIPETSAYSVTIGEIENGQFAPTDRRPQSCLCDWDEVKQNPLTPGQLYVSASDLYTLILDIMAHFDDVKFFPNMLIFTVKDFPYEKSTEKDEE